MGRGAEGRRDVYDGMKAFLACWRCTWSRGVSLVPHSSLYCIEALDTLDCYVVALL